MGKSNSTSAKAREFRARLIMIELSQVEFSKIIGKSDRTITLWFNTTYIPDIAWLALEALEARYKIEGKYKFS